MINTLKSASYPEAVNHYGFPDWHKSALNDVLLAIRTERGSFYPDKNYGADLNSVLGEQEEIAVLSCARQAVYHFNGIYIKKVSASKAGFKFTVIANGFEGEVFVPIEYYV